MSARPPNILVTGTPGTGKTTTSQMVAEQAGLTYINVGDWVKQHELHSGYDEEHEALIIDEDKVVDALEDVVAAGGCLVDYHSCDFFPESQLACIATSCRVDYHSCDFFPERWFDLVVVLQTDNTVLYERLERRGYPQAKITENVECEIMMVLLQEAHDSYDQNIVVPLPSNNPQEMESNVQRILQWIAAYKSQHGLS